MGAVGKSKVVVVVLVLRDFSGLNLNGFIGWTGCAPKRYSDVRKRLKTMNKIKETRLKPVTKIPC